MFKIHFSISSIFRTEFPETQKYFEIFFSPDRDGISVAGRRKPPVSDFSRVGRRFQPDTLAQGTTN
jgi:hypothetical protein